MSRFKVGDIVTSTDKPRVHACRIHIIVDNWVRCEMIKKDKTPYKNPWFCTKLDSLRIFY